MATVRWLGVAQDLPQIDDHTFANTYAGGDTVEVEINKKTLILTLGTDVTLADVAAETAAMINAANATAGRLGTTDEIRNFGGQEIAEFTEISATASGAVLRTISTAGVPVTIAVSVTTAGDGTVGSSNIQAATGKNFFNNADNWSGGSLPSASDTIRYDQGSVDVKYGLNEESGSPILDLNLIRTNGYTGNIGLPAINALGYAEYRSQYLYLGKSANDAQSITIGDQDGTLTPAGFTYIDWGDGVPTLNNSLTVYDAPQKSSSTGWPVRIIRGLKINGHFYSGDVSVGHDPTVSTTEFSSVSVHGDATLYIGSFGRYLSASTITQTGGTLNSVCADSGGTPPAMTITGGAADISGSSLTSLIISSGGTVTYSSLLGASAVTATSVSVYSGGSLLEKLNAATITNMTVYSGATLTHPRDRFTFTNGIDFAGCKPSDVTWDAPPHKTWTPSAI